ncbi:acyl carrier protein [Paenibacillus sp. CMAA1739]|uniref:acyl carrier protein n=1 Tax=Paenibacillus ottowii TaxID=2315729 RepID=UPI0027316A73|nr:MULTISPECIES: acyl carrier protein [Paenibacillus]MDP1510657.1 acyl carrier protein [Paenibacillus ottowii]MEC4566073.1 acyl carrier protein [Paenibacillus sp. CMAA1739]
MDLKTKLELLEDMLEADQGSLEITTSLDTLPDWDSVAAISLIALVDEHFDKRITGAMIKEFKTVQDIINIME